MNTLNSIPLTTELKQLINAEMAHHYKIIPKSNNENEIDFYISDEDVFPYTKDELSIYLGKTVHLTKIPKDEITSAIFRHYRQGTSARNEISANRVTSDGNFLEELIIEAKDIDASDIHFESYENNARVRFRIDGMLIEKYNIPQDDYLELINKIKIKSTLDITEKRLPQDGRINFENFDLRVSILPTLHGEKVVMRLLGKDATNIDIDFLGMDDEQLLIYKNAIRKSNGIILISGPTGSGKTTTLYATLKILNDINRNIVTVEDPIEYTLKGINQVQLKENIGLTFASALRSFLRQDPDIIMLGEIRDPETAQMAIRASLTGHLVLSTIHTNSALGTITRLIDMGVPLFYIAETLNISVAQRLLRCLCNTCKKEVPLNLEELPHMFRNAYDISSHYVAEGCDLCYYTGYNGRKAIYEIIEITKDLLSALKKDAHNPNIKEDFNLQTLSDKAFQLFIKGETSLEEVYSILLKS